MKLVEGMARPATAVWASSLVAAMLQASVLGSALLPGSAAAGSIFGTNLVVNGDAEADAGSANGSAIGPVTGFSTTGNFTVVIYGPGFGFPLPTDPGPADRGLNFFAGGPNIASSSASQHIDLAAGAGPIDSGTVSFDLSAYLGGFGSQRDNAVLTLQFLDAGSSLLASAAIGPVTNVDRGNQSGLLLREASGLVPAGTRFAQVELQLSRFDGSYNDGYADNLSLVLSAVPEPASPALLAAGLALLGLGARVRRQGGLAVERPRAA